MDNEGTFIQLIRQAKLGDRGAMDCLAETVRQRLYGYIYRLTLSHDLTQDLLQETLMKMVESISELEHPDRFWCWLFRTALGKVQHHYRDVARTQRVEFSALSRQRMSDYLAEDHDDGLSYAAREELYTTIVSAMARLRLPYRNVLMLRCYEQMSYAQIADQMGCKELRARVLFFRAKRSLHRQLTRRGFGKGLLLTGLGLFGVLTAPAEGAPAAGGVTAASLHVGPTAAFAGVATTPSVIVLAAAAIGAAITFTMEHSVYFAVSVVVGLISFAIGLYLD
jgi:RNA polymerase sigma-70 factor (ECF subfamily)